MIENDWFLAYVVEQPCIAALLGGCVALLLLELRYKIISTLIANDSNNGGSGGSSGFWGCGGDGDGGGGGGGGD